MTTSSTAAFNLDLNELIEEAFERCGKELRTGYEFRTARRSLNLLTIEWANRGINLWTIEQGQIQINTNAGQITYPLPVDTIDLVDQVIRQGVGQNQVDININRISESTYATIPTKNAYGRPIQVWIDRQGGTTNTIASTTLNGGISASDTTITVVSTEGLATQGYIYIGTELISYQNITGNQLLNCNRGQGGTTAVLHNSGASITVTRVPNINIWPTGNPGQQYTFVYWRMRRMQDAGTGATTQDIPFRFIPALVAGLAYHLSVKLPDVDPQRVVGLKQAYEEVFMQAAEEDREKAPLRFVPRNMFYSR
jgi:hypothetical protein